MASAEPVQCSPVNTPTRLMSPATMAPANVGTNGRRTTRTVTAVAMSHASGPTSQPQVAKKSCDRVRPVAAPRRLTTMA